MVIEVDDKTLKDLELDINEMAEFQAAEGLEAEYAKKSDFSKPLLAYDVFKDLYRLRSQEMRKGYYNFRIFPDGTEMKSWVPDTRRQYIAGVQALYLIVYPEIMNKEHADFQEVIEKIKMKESALFSQFKYDEVVPNEKGELVKTNVSFIPEPDTEVYVVRPDGQYTKTVGGWDFKAEHYWNAMVQVYDELFCQISLLAHKLNYFKTKVRIY